MKFYNTITAIAFDIILMLAFIAIVTSFIASPSSSSEISLDGGWYESNGVEADLNSLYGTTSISRTFDITENNAIILYRARNCYTDVYINGTLIDEDERVESRIIGLSPGSRWHSITLPSSGESVTVTIEVTACFENSHATIDNIYYGKVADVYRKISSTHLFGFLVCIFLQLLSIVIICIYIYIRRLFTVSTDLFYLGITSFFTSQWASCESLIAQLYLGHSEFYHILGYLSLVAIPLGFGMYSASRLSGKYATFARAYSIVSAVNIFLTSLLHITGIYEFHYTLITVHILLFILIPVLIMLVLSYRNERTTVYHVIAPIVIFITCISISLCKYISGSYSNYTAYVRIALVSFLFFLIMYQINEIAVTFSKGLKADKLHDMALNDHMTGLYNRTALNEHREEYNHMIKSFSPLGVIQFDVNNLKRVNDTLGHEMGDKLINAASNGLKQAFKNHCRIYRTGGDEFLVIINDTNPTAIYDSGIKKLCEYCEKFNCQPNMKFKLIIAHGFVSTKGNITLEEAVDMADVLMYQNKRELKSTLIEGSHI